MSKLITVITSGVSFAAVTSIVIGVCRAIEPSEPYEYRTPLQRRADKIGEQCCKELKQIDRKWRRSR